MFRIMGDSEGGLADLIPRNLPLVMGYDTGTSGVVWTPADWALFPGSIHVHVDQGYGSTRATEAHVLVFDIETGAFMPAQAQTLIDNNESQRPTIYVNRSNMNATISSALRSKKWKGDIILSFPGWKPGDAVPEIPAQCRYVAIQNTITPHYDLSIVRDDTWPFSGVAVPVTYGLPAQEAVDHIRAAGLDVTTNPLRDIGHTYVSHGSTPVGGSIVPLESHVILHVVQVS